MYIVLVEDFTPHGVTITDDLRRAYPNCRVERIRSEFSFRARLNDFVLTPPDIIIMDIMLPWVTPRDGDQEPPDEVLKAGFYMAGLRCRKLLEEHETTRNIPVVFYTILVPADMEDMFQEDPQTIRLSKGVSTAPLVELIYQLTGDPPIYIIN